MRPWAEARSCGSSAWVSGDVEPHGVHVAVDRGGRVRVARALDHGEAACGEIAHDGQSDAAVSPADHREGCQPYIASISAA